MRRGTISSAALAWMLFWFGSSAHVPLSATSSFVQDKLQFSNSLFRAIFGTLFGVYCIVI